MKIGSIVKIIKDCEFKNKLTVITKCVSYNEYKLYIDRSTGVWNDCDIEYMKILDKKETMKKIMEENERKDWI